MKKLLFTIVLFFSVLMCSQAQTDSDMALYLRGGYSWFTGVFGAEMQINDIGIGGGWMPTKRPLSGISENAYGICATYYGGAPSETSMYFSLGYIINGYREENSWGYYETGNMFGVLGGYKWGSDKIDVKAGIGAGFYDGSTVFTGEITLGVNLLSF